MTTEHLLTRLGAYLDQNALAQYNAAGGYLNHPDMPGVLFAGADTPDTALVLTVVGADPGLGDIDVAFAFRATGVSTLGVETIADNVFDHFRAVIQTRVFHHGTAVVLPELHWDDITVTNVERIQRGTAELSSPAKHQSTRFARTDIYRITHYQN